MRHLFLLLAFFVMSAISADAQEMQKETEKAQLSRQIVEKPRFFDNWSFTFAGGVYHPMCFDLKYLVDCSGFAGLVELRKQVTPGFGIGLECDGYYRMNRKERQDPRTVIGPAFHFNLMNIFGGYKGRPRLFELELLAMPAWGHLYRGTNYVLFPEENYFATKFGLDLNFNLGRARQWTLSLKPAAVLDVTSKAPVPAYTTTPYAAYDVQKMDLQLFVGCTYHFRNHKARRHFNNAVLPTNDEEINRLNEVVNFLRDDVDARDRQIRELKQEIEALKQPKIEENPTEN